MDAATTYFLLLKQLAILTMDIVLIIIMALLLSCSFNQESRSSISQTVTAPLISPASPSMPSNTLPSSITPPSASSNEGKAINIHARTDNIIVDHSNWDWYTSQDKQAINRVASLKIYFSHASVGSNILSGFDALHSANSSMYPLVKQKEGASSPSQTNKGIIYENPRGNPDWPLKISRFEDEILKGWHYPKVDISMNKFCYIDQNADIKIYLKSMTTLETNYPDTQFVYFSMPLTTGNNSASVLRAKFNKELRTWIATQNNKAFFDLADIESNSPAETKQIFFSDGTPYEKLFQGYTSDGGHLNPAGSTRIATGLYSLFGQLTNQPTSP